MSRITKRIIQQQSERQGQDNYRIARKELGRAHQRYAVKGAVLIKQTNHRA